MPDDQITSWRIVPVEHLEGVDAKAGRSAFSGEGARLYGGRWNSQGVPVAYTAGSRSLALLEILVHLETPRLLRHYLLVPVTCSRAEVGVLDTPPEDWRMHPAPRSTQRAGDEWVQAARSPVLRVPSVVVPAEWNYLVNPRHSGFAGLDIGAPEVLDVDERLTE